MRTTAHAVAVLVAEEGERARLDRVVVGHLLGRHLGVGADRRRSPRPRSSASVVAADRAVMVEVEAQALRRRPASPPASRARRGGGAARRAAGAWPSGSAGPPRGARRRCARRTRSPTAIAPSRTTPRWAMTAGASFCVSSDLDARAGGGLEPAAVADLPARLGVEGRLRGHDVDRRRRSRTGPRVPLAARDERQHLGLPLARRGRRRSATSTPPPASTSGAASASAKRCAPRARARCSSIARSKPGAVDGEPLAARGCPRSGRAGSRRCRRAGRRPRPGASPSPRPARARPRPRAAPGRGRASPRSAPPRRGPTSAMCRVLGLRSPDRRRPCVRRPRRRPRRGTAGRARGASRGAPRGAAGGGARSRAPRSTAGCRRR